MAGRQRGPTSASPTSSALRSRSSNARPSDGTRADPDRHGHQPPADPQPRAQPSRRLARRARRRHGPRRGDARPCRPSSRPLAGRRAGDPRLRREYVTAKGSYLYDADGRAYLDLHTGEGFASLGHNHPDVREVLEATLAADLLDGVQIHYSPLAGMLAEELSQRLPSGLDARVLRQHAAPRRSTRR